MKLMADFVFLIRILCPLSFSQRACGFLAAVDRVVPSHTRARRVDTPAWLAVRNPFCSCLSRVGVFGRLPHARVAPQSSSLYLGIVCMSVHRYLILPSIASPRSGRGKCQSCLV